jgi:hypothetical protein
MVFSLTLKLCAAYSYRSLKGRIFCIGVHQVLVLLKKGTNFVGNWMKKTCDVRVGCRMKETWLAGNGDGNLLSMDSDEGNMHSRELHRGNMFSRPDEGNMCSAGNRMLDEGNFSRELDEGNILSRDTDEGDTYDREPAEGNRFSRLDEGTC